MLATYLVYSHKHGEDVSIYADNESAEKALAQIAREYWSDAVAYEPEIGETPPEDDTKAIETYFGVFQDTEGYDIKTVEVQGVLIGLLWTERDCADIGKDLEVKAEDAIERGRESAKAIGNTANELIAEQLSSAIYNGEDQ